MGDDNTNTLSAEAQRALAMSRDFRAYPGDFFVRAAVQGAPSPADLVQMLDEAVHGGQQGACLSTAAASRLLQQIGVQPWHLKAGTRGGSDYELAVTLLSGERTVRVRRYPQPHVLSVA
jgi:hypothetical protein